MSTSPEPSPPEFDAIIRQLSAMPLAAPALSRDRLIFRAGQARGTARLVRLFALTTILLTSISLGAGIYMGGWIRPDTPVLKTINIHHHEAAQPNPVLIQPPPFSTQVDAAAKKGSPAVLPRWHPLAKEIDALLSENSPPPLAAAASAPASSSVEDVLGLPADSLTEMERIRWATALNLRDK